MSPVVVIDTNFAGEDSYIWFGHDPVTDRGNPLGYVTSSLADKWSLEVDSVTINGKEFSTTSPGYALL